MEICINNIVPNYRAYLENIGISQFLRLLEAVKKSRMSVKPTAEKSLKNEKNETHQSLAIDDKPDYNSRKRKERGEERKTYPPLSWNLPIIIVQGYSYHQYMEHHFVACQTLRRMLHAKVNGGTLKLPPKKQAFDNDCVPRRRRKEVVAVITCSDNDDAYLLWKNDPELPKTIWESSRNMEKAYWCMYSKPQSCDTLWPKLRNVKMKIETS